jgi:glycosyltransferase involved in cell wall biosynthesis
MDSLSIVIPVYNAAPTIERLLERLEACLETIGLPFEVIAVNDGSADESWRLLELASRRCLWLTAIDLARNAGQHNALLRGIRAARHDVIVTMDDDLQHPPEEIPRLLQGLASGCDVVYGSPDREQHGVWRDAASQSTKFVLSRVLGASTAQRISAFRAFRTPLRAAFEHDEGSSVNLDVLLARATTRFAAVTVRHDAREAGTSNYTFRKLLSHALNMLRGFRTSAPRVRDGDGPRLT